MLHDGQELVKSKKYRAENVSHLRNALERFVSNDSSGTIFLNCSENIYNIE